jgi:hypothetical protein
MKNHEQQFEIFEFQETGKYEQGNLPTPGASAR